MSDKVPDENGGTGRSATSDKELEARRSALAGKLAERRSREPSGNDGDGEAQKGYALAVKVSSEFIAGVVVGAVLGYGFDHVLGTSPWGMIVFLMLGFAAGVLNVLRAVGKVAERPKI